MHLHADRIGRRALTVSAAAGSILAATLTFAANPANADYTAQVKAGTLQIRGDGASDKLTLAPTPTTLILDVGDDNTADFTFDRSTFTNVSVQAGDGDDEVRVLNAATPFDMTIDGGAGDDTLLGGNGNETLIGGSGDDFVDGNIGADTARLGGGNDTFEWDPGDGSDSVDGQSGRDTIAFNGSNIGEEIHVSGHTLTRNVAAVSMDFTAEAVNVSPHGGVDNITVDGTDGDDEMDVTGGTVTFGDTTVSLTDPEPTDRLIADGGAGDDTAVYTGTAGDDQVSFGRNGDAVFVASGDAIANARAEHMLIKGLGGNDAITGQNGVATVIPQVTLDGGAGDDDLRGGDSADTLLGGSGNDHIDGNIGADTAQMGTGNDTFQWDPGDGSDTVDGQSGTDTLAFNGSNAGEEITVSGHQLTRNIANITMDYDSVEGVNVRTLGSADTVTTGDLTGVNTVNVDLGAFDGGDDGAADDVIVGGTDGDDSFDLGDNSIVLGGATVSVSNQHTLDRLIADGGLGDDTAEADGTAGDDQISYGRNGDAVFVSEGTSLVNARTEHLRIAGLAGNDLIAGQNGVATVIPQVTLDGGAGDDDLRGGDSADTLLGGSGNDHIDGNIGADTAQMGTGNDTFQWDPGDGSDTVDGQSGTDTLAFNGSNIGEQMDAVADGGHVRFTRNVAGIAMDLDNVEGMAVRTLGGIDQMHVGDLTGTDMKTAAIDLAAFDGTPDATADTVTLDGTAKRDNVAVTKAGGQVLVKGLPTSATITGSDPGVDLLRVNTLAGDDNVTVAPDVADLMATAVDLGADS